MTELKKGMYEYISSKKPSKLFGIVYGQTRPRFCRLAKNAGWYNKNGEKLGFGDLSSQDLNNISQDIKENELFIVLNESDASWYFTPTGKGAKKPKLKEDSPGKDYVSNHCYFLVTRKKVFYVSDVYKAKHFVRNKVKIYVLSREEAKKLIYDS
jgi:hypothetical protein